MDKLFKTKIKEVAAEMNTIGSCKEKIVIGFDGFVDEILHVVDKRMNAQEYERLKTMKAYGERIVKAAGLSTNIEMVTIQEKLGGNGPILCNALSTFGLSATYIGCLGYPHIEKVFEPMQENMTIYTVAKPGHTDAVEFEDGKIMVGKHKSLEEVNWENLKKVVGIDKLIQIINDAKLVGLENWTMLPHMSQIWRNLLDEVLPHIDKNKERYVFFDLADPEKRTAQDIVDALDLIKSFGEYFKVILGLNLKETTEISTVFGLNIPMLDKDTIDLKSLTEQVAKNLGIYCLVVHTNTEASTCIDGQYYCVAGPYTPNPKLTTGAGDNFNAGFCLGQALGLKPEALLLLGVGTSGYYVRNAKSPTFNDLAKFLEDWAEEKI
jgi:hypothetical protein